MPPVREKDQLRLVLPWPAQQSRPRGAGSLWSGSEGPGPCPQGVHRLARKEIIYDLGAGPDSSPINNHLPQTWKAIVGLPQLRRQRQTQEKQQWEAKRLINGGRWCPGRQKEVRANSGTDWSWTRSGPSRQPSTHWESPGSKQGPTPAYPRLNFMLIPPSSALNQGVSRF